jgi:Putative Ig domain
MKYVYVDTVDGVASPSTPVHDTDVFPPASGRFLKLSTAEANATVRAVTEDLTFDCRGSVADTFVTIGPSLLAATVTVRGDVASAEWATSEYLISHNSSQTQTIQFTFPRDVLVEGIRAEHIGTVSAPRAIFFNVGAGTPTHTVRGCKIRIGGTGASAGYGIRNSSTLAQTLIVENCIVQCFSGGGPRLGISGAGAVITRFINNTVQGINNGAGLDNGDVTTNCVIFDCSPDVNNCPGASYCATDDVLSGGTGNINGLNWADQFVDYPNGDFTPLQTGAIAAAGVGPTLDSNVPVTDIAGITRSGNSCTIGAAEIQFSSGGTIGYPTTAVPAAGFQYQDCATDPVAEPQNSLWRTDGNVSQVQLSADQCLYTLRTNQANGDVAVGGDGHYIITPDTSFTDGQVVTFTYRFYDFTTKDWGLTGTVTVTVDVPADLAPEVVTPIPDQSKTVGASAALNIASNFSGADSYTASPLPAGVTFSGSSFSGTVTTAEVVNTTVTATNANGSTPDTFTWTITAAAVAPVLAPIGNQATTEATAGVVLTPSATGTAPLTWGAVQLPPGYTVNTNTGVVTAAGDRASQGTFPCSINVQNSAGSDFEAFNWVVSSSDPVLGAIGNQTDAESTGGVVLSPTATGPGTYAWSATGLPTAYTINPTTGQVTAPGNTGNQGTYTTTVIVTTEYGNDSEQFTWTVTSSNPTLVTPIPDQSNRQGDVVSFSVAANFSGETGYSSSVLPVGVTFNDVSGAFSGSPTTIQSGTVTVTATNTYGIVQDTFNWNIVSGAPALITPIGDRYILLNEPLSGAGSVAGNFLGGTSYTAAPLPAGVTFNGTNGTFSGTPTVLGETTVVVTAINSYGSTPDTFIAHVVEEVPATDSNKLKQPLINKLVRRFIR